MVAVCFVCDLREWQGGASKDEWVDVQAGTKRNHKKAKVETGNTRTFALFTNAMRKDRQLASHLLPQLPSVFLLTFSLSFSLLPLFSGLFLVDISSVSPYSSSCLPDNAFAECQKKKGYSRRRKKEKKKAARTQVAEDRRRACLSIVHNR
ncbi:MAG: hypothetical protein JOS17DRAFT_756512 [Linnemannia elongata]|nr:MAG: hypothetical protein JOS17DRAFT_756512 [Linnemannia elongata]